MRLRLASLMVLSAVATTAPAAADGFFGLTADTRVDQLPNCKPGRSEYDFDCEFPGTPPFSKFEINFDPTKGTCGITATAGPFETEHEARAALKSTLDFIDGFPGRGLTRPDLREIANGGASSAWFEDAKHDKGLVMPWFFDEPRADKLTSMYLFVSKALLKPGVEIRVNGYYAERMLCVPPPVRTKYPIREIHPDTLK